MSVLGAASDAFIASVASLYLLALEGTSIHIGLLATTEHFQKIARLFGLRIVAALGKARLMAASRISASIPVLLLIALPELDLPLAHAVLIAIGVFALREFLRQAGNTVWWPLIQDNTTGDPLGAYMARLRIRQRGAALLVPIAVGWYLGANPTAARFALPFALGIAASFLCGFWASRVSEGPLRQREEGVFGRLLYAYRLKPVWWLSVFMLVYNLLFAATYSFWVVALTDRGVSARAFVWMNSASALGQVCILSWWGRLVDRHGSRSSLSLSLCVKAALGLAWLWMPADHVWLMTWGFGIYILWGILDGGQNLARTRAMMDAVAGDHQVEGFNAIMYASALGGMIGGIGGGALLDWLARVPPVGLPFSADQAYLCVVQMALVAVYVVSRRLHGADGQPTLRSLIANRVTGESS